MKFSTLSTAAFGLLVSEISAFPHLMTDPNSPLFVAAKEKRLSVAPQGVGALPLLPPPFDAAAQYVSNKGAHKVRIEYNALIIAHV